MVPVSSQQNSVQYGYKRTAQELNARDNQEKWPSPKKEKTGEASRQVFDFNEEKLQ